MDSSFYGAVGRQSTILGEDPLFNDHDPVAIISASRMNTQGHTKSSYHLQKSLTTASIRRICRRDSAQPRRFPEFRLSSG